MRKDRKEYLLHSFPTVPYQFMEKMKGREAQNFCVFLTNGNELFVRCYHRYWGGQIFERQRYVFAKDGAVRYVCDADMEKRPINWRWSKVFREPSFYTGGFTYGMWRSNIGNGYCVINREAIGESDMKYCPIERSGGLMILFLKLYAQHPNIEYLYKTNYGSLIQPIHTGENGAHISVCDGIDWKSNNLLKMLHLNRTEFKLLQGKEELYEEYIWWRKEYPKGSPEQLIAAAEKFGAAFGTATNLMEKTGYSIFRISRYLTEQQVELRMYQDYLEQCAKLKYNLHDTAICFPKNFMAMHERLTSIINAMKYVERKQQDKEKGRQISKQIQVAKKYRKEMEFEYGDLILRQPYSADEIINEGKALCHCVGGYVERHLKAQTNIFFIRQRDKPDTPYYTIEVSNDFKVIQCHGYKNDKDGKPNEIKEFERIYTKYLEGLRNGSNHIDRTA